MSVGIFKNGKYNKVAGNAKDSTAANTTYNNGTSGLQANNVQGAIDEVSAKIGQENISQVGNSVTGAINNLNSNLNGLFKIYYGTFNVEGEDFGITPPNFEGYTLISVSLAGANMIMTDISYVIRQDIGNKIEVQTISSYVGKLLYGHLVYIKSDFIN